MKIENHILSILQLYEFSMALGKSLDFKVTCDTFLKLILKRKNLNASWILETSNDKAKFLFSLPHAKIEESKISKSHRVLLNEIDTVLKTNFNDDLNVLSPIKLQEGYLAIFKLTKNRYLLLYSRKDNIKTKDLNQLQPVIDKLSISIEACEAFEAQKALLSDLELKNQELRDYAHMVSHDLKSPLRSIDALTAWLKSDYDNKIDDAGKESLKLIRNNVEKMDTLIKGILEYSTIGKNQLDRYNVDINRLITDIVDIINIPDSITVEKKGQLPVVKGNKYRLQQLFQNIIDNAIHYNDKASGLIEIGVEDRDNFWEFYIKDNGKGIDEAYFDKIFKTFQKLENNTQSTGIGLSIVKKIVDLYGGKVWLTSKVGSGTTFFFTIKK